MSVTFTAEDTSTVDARLYRVTCESGADLGEYTGYGNAYAEARAHGLLCTEDLCQGYGADVDRVYPAGEPTSINVCNRNGVDVLRALGYVVDLVEPELCGSADAEAFLGRVELALGVGVNDAALPEIAWRGDGGATYVDGARRQGYLSERLTQLRELALACRARGLRVTWG